MYNLPGNYFLLHHVPFHDRFPSHRTFCRPRRNGIHRFWPSEVNNPDNHGEGGCFLCPNDPIKHTSHRCNSLRNRCRADAFYYLRKCCRPLRRTRSFPDAGLVPDGWFLHNVLFLFVQQTYGKCREEFSLYAIQNRTYPLPSHYAYYCYSTL